MKNETLKSRIQKGKECIRQLEAKGESLNLTRDWNIDSVVSLTKALEGGATAHKNMKNTKHKTFGKKVIGIAQFITVATIALVIILSMPKACTRPDDATRLLEQQGYTNIRITGWRPLMGKDDNISTGFEATSPSGQQVSGAVTSGVIFKGSTIRFD